MKPESMDAVFQALAHEHRRRVLDIVREQPGCTVNDVCAYFETSRIAVMKHLRVLEQAKLIASEKEGRTRHMYFNAMPIQMIYDRWTTDYSSFWASRLADMKYRIESRGGKTAGTAAGARKGGNRKIKRKGGQKT